ncbi:uncharacterized protein KY384_008400 [Bacidia gigantensis]|uniref:uncharacterized protein n=1 Tax=Bacidia gigantensis TaxID=2732470 RepID=UPI001D03C420|nr:uncharacterized protein KY384_008400 [Bacidia gigantensis]KAG8526971.1 hypothetical protein KY384_008400 [Bacidia gigantensis]
MPILGLQPFVDLFDDDDAVSFLKKFLSRRGRTATGDKKATPSTKLGFTDFNPNYEQGAEGSEEPLNVDVIAIHGLNGHPTGSWTGLDSKSLWLRDSLPEELPGARIFSYGYPADIVFNPSKATLYDLAVGFVSSLMTKRLPRQRRPIIFVAHSMGGIICKKALILALNDPYYRPILEDCAAVLFFGTPHRGSELSGIGGIAADIFNLALFVSGSGMMTGRAREDLIRSLNPRSRELLEINRDFRQVADKFRILSFYETEETTPLGKLVVNQTSAILSLPGEEDMPIHRNHRDMIRLAKGEHDYDNVVQRLQSLSHDACYESPMEESEKTIVQSLHAVDISDYYLSLPGAASGTCKWLFDHPCYIKWQQQCDDAILWMSGHPGSGKTVMTSFLVSTYIEQGRAGKLSAGVCFFLCNEDLNEQNDARAILRSLIFQILTEHRGFINHLKQAIDRAQGSPHLVGSFDRLWQLFEDILEDQRLGSMYIIIDALDECRATTRLKLLQNIAKLLSKPRKSSACKVKLFVSSRPDVRVSGILPKSKVFHISLEETRKETDLDLELFITQRVNNIGERFQASRTTADSTKQALIQNADRTFLWANFVLQILDEELRATPRDWARIVQELPKDLEDVYLRFLQRILDSDLSGVMDILQMMVVSRRPLHRNELNIVCNMPEAVAQGCRDVSSLRDSYLSQNMDLYLRVVLGPLVRISDDKVYFVHLSLKEFLSGPALRSESRAQYQKYHVEIAKANLLATKVCTEYLSLDDFDVDLFSSRTSTMNENSPVPSESPANSNNDEDGWMNGLSIFGTNILQDFSERVADRCDHLDKRFEFFDYASRYWAKHLSQSQNISSKLLQSEAMELLNRKGSFRSSNWAQYYAAFTWPEKVWPSELAFIETICYFGHIVLLQDYLERCKTSLGNLQFGLYWAASEGHAATVQRLLQTNIDPNSTYTDRSPLCTAAAAGHLEVVKLLTGASQVDVNFRGHHDSTPIAEAATNGHQEIIEHLLAQIQTVPDITDHNGHTPLIKAVWGRHELIVRHLLADERVQAKLEDNSGNTPLSYAVIEGKIEVVRMLKKDPSVDPDHVNRKGRTPFSLAAGEGHVEILRILKGCKSTKAKDNEGRNAYSWAASRGHVDAIKAMDKWKVFGIDEPDKSGWTPLFWALEPQGYLTMLGLLDSGSVNISRTDHGGRTVLEWAHGYQGKEKFLQSWLRNKTVETINA